MPQSTLPPADVLTDDQLTRKLWHLRDTLSYHFESWQHEIQSVEEGRVSPSERFAMDMALKVRGALQRFEELGGAKLLETATTRLRTGESASSKLRNEVQEIHQVADALLNLSQRASGAVRGRGSP